MRPSHIVLIGMFSGVPVTATAQVQTTPLGPGTRVRIWAPAHGFVKRKAFVSAIRGDTLLLTRDTIVVRRGRSIRDSSTTYLPLADIHRLEVMTGQRPNVVGGLKWGVLIGGGLGTTMGVLSAATCNDTGFLNDCGPEWIAYGAIGGALYGLLIGTVVGLLDKTEDWQQVWVTPSVEPPVVTPTVQVIPAGVAIGVHLRL
jgi:hypothetical protein